MHGKKIMLTGNEIRTKFITYFEERDHEIVKSSPVVPKDDPTLLFVNAGMVQFKNVFLGTDKRSYTRAVSSQKCIRVSGKHNDLSQVGKTPRHQTFFEMLGNFSFGDYFKKEAIEFHWELLVKELELPEDKLVVTVFRDDDEARELWKKVVKLPDSRIYRLDEKDNFWSMGETGPCGPCSEIIFDNGDGSGCDKPECDPSCDCGRFLEVGNLVFMQYERDQDGKVTPLPKPSIDTGSGLERIASIIQGKKSNYETDLISPLIEECSSILNKPYEPDSESGFYFRVIADHMRTCSFMIADNIYPSNEWQGYVLRRLMRRAITHGLFLGHEEPFLYRLVPTLTGIMGEAYPELVEQERFIKEIFLAEERGFGHTLRKGLDRLYDKLKKLERSGGEILPADFCFRLSDTEGIPVDIIEEVAGKQGVLVDRKGFDELLEKQREQSRKSGGVGAAVTIPDSAWTVFDDKTTPEFTGYDTLTGQNTGIIRHTFREGCSLVVLARTPFYAEAGGQVGDAGLITSEDYELEVLDTRMISGEICHICKLTRGEISQSSCTAQVDEKRRRDIERNHTATHLLQAALRSVLGDHVRQAGSLVTDSHLRFDFTHFSPLSEKEIRRIEEAVNSEILSNRPVDSGLYNHDEAIKMGAIALFGEKYDTTVRLVEVNNVSKELCGGTHVRATGEIGFFSIRTESGIAAGVRRIEALTGQAFFEHFRNLDSLVNEAAGVLRTTREEVTGKIGELQQKLKLAVSENRKLARKLATGSSETEQPEVISGLHVVAKMVDTPDMDSLREMGDYYRQKGVSGVLGSTIDSRPVFCVFSSDKAIERGFDAGKAAKKLGKNAGGGGGGRRNFAQGGASDTAALENVLSEALVLFEEMIAGNG